ncbi:hypothetical protein [Spirochaeta dissipatitropha]
MTEKEAKIEALYQELSQIDSTSDVQLYGKVKNKLFAITYEYYKQRYGKRVETDYGFTIEFEYGEEVFKTVADCLVSFVNSPVAVFLHYLNTSVSRVVKSAKEEDYNQNTRAGIYVPRKTSKKAKDIANEAEKAGKNLNSLSVQESLSMEYGVPLKTVQRYVELLSFHRAPNEFGDSDDGGDSDDAVSFFDIYNNPDEIAHDKLLEKQMDRENELKIRLSALDDIWQKKQERVQPRLSFLLTAQLLREIRTQDGFLDAFMELYRSYKFINTEVLDSFLKDKELPTQKEIASIFELDETQVSRDLKNIRIDLKKCQEFD